MAISGTVKTYVGSYQAAIDFPRSVIYGAHKMESIRIFQALKIDPKTILHVDTELQIEAHWSKFTVIFSSCILSLEFQEKHKDDMLFIQVPDDIAMDGLAEFFAEKTGITGFKNVRFDNASNIFFPFGTAHEKVNHGKIELAMRFQNEVRKWIAAGRPYRTDEQVAEIFDTFCAKCSDFVATVNKPNQGRCNICGCNILRNNKDATARIFNKLALATCNCPKDPPMWTENVTVPDADIKGREAALYQAYLQEARLAQPQQAGTSGGCNCGKKIVNNKVVNA